MRIEDRKKSLAKESDSEKSVGLYFKYFQFIACVIGGAWILLLCTYKIVVVPEQSERYHRQIIYYSQIPSDNVTRVIERDMNVYGDQYQNIPSRTPKDQLIKSHALGRYAEDILKEAKPYIEAFAAESASPETALNLSPTAKIGQEIMKNLKGIQDNPLGKEIITDSGEIAKKVIEKRLGLTDKDAKDKKELAPQGSCCCCCHPDFERSTDGGDSQPHNKDRHSKPSNSKPNEWSAS